MVPGKKTQKKQPKAEAKNIPKLFYTLGNMPICRYALLFAEGP